MIYLRENPPVGITVYTVTMESTVEVLLKKLHPDAEFPTKATEGSGLFDVYAIEDTWLGEPFPVKVRTGLSLELPSGYELEIRPRSSLSGKGILLLNSPGTLDSDYRGELFVLLMKITTIESTTQQTSSSYQIHKGDRIAQIKVNKLVPTAFREVDSLSVTDRGEKGFGSTGR